MKNVIVRMLRQTTPEIIRWKNLPGVAMAGRCGAALASFLNARVRPLNFAICNVFVAIAAAKQFPRSQSHANIR
ncbi:MAG: hypothetical protein WA414_00505 [Acidobacteriaceae bacterium]